MTRDELLTKLAMDLYYWPEGPCYTPYGWGCELDDGEVVITNESRTLHARKEHWLDTLREVKREHPQPRATFEVTPEEEEAFKALEASAGKDWRGPEDGLPPVGTVCEFKLHHEDDSAYQECYIVGESKDKE